MSFGDVVRARLSSDPATPLLTWYDEGRVGATGERLELSGATAANWAAKIANLLRDECGLEPGDEVAVAAPAHWLTAAVLWGCWTAGASVLLVPAGSPVPDVPVCFVHEPRFGEVSADEVYGLALTAMAGPVRTPGLTDAVAAARVHGDALPFVPTDGVALTVAGTEVGYGHLVAGPTGRLLVDDAWTTAAAVVVAAARCWGPDASTVLLAGPVDDARVAALRAAERAR